MALKKKKAVFAVLECVRVGTTLHVGIRIRMQRVISSDNANTQTCC